MQSSNELFTISQWAKNCPPSVPKIQASLDAFIIRSPKTIKHLLDCLLGVMLLCEQELANRKPSLTPLPWIDTIRYKHGWLMDSNRDEAQFLEQLLVDCQRLLGIITDQTLTSAVDRQTLLLKRVIDPSYLPQQLNLVAEPDTTCVQWQVFAQLQQVSHPWLPRLKQSVRRKHILFMLADILKLAKDQTLLGISHKYQDETLERAIKRGQPDHTKFTYLNYQQAISDLNQCVYKPPSSIPLQALEKFIGSTDKEMRERVAEVERPKVGCQFTHSLFGDVIAPLLFSAPRNFNDYDTVIEALEKKNMHELVELVAKIRELRDEGNRDVFMGTKRYFETAGEGSLAFYLEKIHELINAKNDGCLLNIIEDLRKWGSDQCSVQLQELVDDYAYKMLVHRVAILIIKINEAIKRLPALQKPLDDMKSRIRELVTTKYIKPNGAKTITKPCNLSDRPHHSSFLYYEICKINHPEWSDSTHTNAKVIYLLNDDSRECYRVHLYQGRFYKLKIADNGNVALSPFSTKGLLSHNKPNWACFVMNHRGEIFAHSHTSAIIHSSFMAGGYVVFAGEMKTASDGSLRAVSGYSGHYKPEKRHFETTVKYWAQRKVALDSVDFYVFDYDRFYNDKRKINAKPGDNRQELANLYLASELLKYSQCHQYQNGQLQEKKSTFTALSQLLKPRQDKVPLSSATAVSHHARPTPQVQPLPNPNAETAQDGQTKIIISPSEEGQPVQPLLGKAIF